MNNPLEPDLAALQARAFIDPEFKMLAVRIAQRLAVQLTDPSEPYNPEVLALHIASDLMPSEEHAAANRKRADEMRAIMDAAPLINRCQMFHRQPCTDCQPTQ